MNLIIVEYSPDLSPELCPFVVDTQIETYVHDLKKVMETIGCDTMVIDKSTVYVDDFHMVLQEHLGKWKPNNRYCVFFA